MTSTIKINVSGTKETFPSSWEQLLIFIAIVWNSQIVSGTSINPIGVKGLQELFYLLLFLFSFFYLVAQIKRDKVIITDFVVLTIVVIILIYSASAAEIRFGQPIHYGLFEERRVLAFLIYFPVVWGIRDGHVTLHQIVTWIIFVSLLCAILSISVVTGIIEPFNVKDVGASKIREARYGIGQLYLSFATLVVFSRLSFSRINYDFLLFIIFVGVLVVVAQTRQILVSLLCALVVIRGPTKLLLWFLPIAIVGYILIENSTHLSGIIEKSQFLVLEIFSSEYLAESARALSTKLILSEFVNGNWFGFGALSPMWEGGFENVYSTHFYLTDLGLFGTLYKFGLLAIPVYAAYYIIQISTLIYIQRHTYYRLLLAAWIQIILMSPVAASIEYRGYISGLILALSVSCMKDIAISKHNKLVLHEK